MARVLAIPDTQYPFAHRDHLNFLKEVNKYYGKFDHIVHLGDEVDFHALGNWDHDPDGYSAGDELKAALKDMHKLYEMFPKVMVCTSNHTARPFRKAFTSGIPKAFLRDYHEFLEAPKGWEWREYWEVDGVRYEHGEGFSGMTAAKKSAIGNMQSTVIGHIHSHAGILYWANEASLLYGFNCGCLIDRHKYAFAYGKKMKDKPILGCGVIEDGIPTFIPMILNKRNRWIGKIIIPHVKIK
ncbi:MAG: phosphoesterase [Candidatus Aenigmarchaeota archaeon]|nr:phosphoesterase [Candidatus Aenigmarchaeota archaeon]